MSLPSTRADAPGAVTLAVDAMGGDHGPAVTVPGAAIARAAHPHWHIVLVGDGELINGALPTGEAPFSVVPAAEAIGMDEAPLEALRRKRGSSLHEGLRMVRAGDAGALVSAGNTGALVAVARHLLEPLPGITRPALVKALPTRRGHSWLLDCGANVEGDAEQLFQFGVMGALLAEVADGIARPRVGLLNIGAEAIKGGDRLRDAAAELADLDGIDFAGFVEGDQLFDGAVDVVVADGLVGNVALKASEGAARFAVDVLRGAFAASWRARLAGWLARRELARVQQQTNPNRYNGATLMGLDGVVVKSHGGADATGFAAAIGFAGDELGHGIAGRLRARLGGLLGLPA